MEGVVVGGVQGAVGVREVVVRFRHYAVPRDLVHDGSRLAYRAPQQRRDRRRLHLYLVMIEPLDLMQLLFDIALGIEISRSVAFALLELAQICCLIRTEYCLKSLCPVQ